MDTFGDLLTKNFQIILSNLVFPIILIIFASFASEIRLQYFNSQEKNQYIKLLKINCPNIEEVVQIKEQFREFSQVYFIYILFIGLFIGILFPLSFISICVNVNYIISFLNYITLTNTSDSSFLYFLVVLFLLFPALINLIVYQVCSTLIKTKLPLNEKENDFCKLKGSQIILYFLYWLSIGFIIGPYVLGVISLSFPTKDNVFSMQQSIWTSNDKLALIFTIFLSLLVMFLSLNFIFDLSLKVKQFPKKVIDPIINYHQSNFPNLKIITNSGEFKGQLKDFQNKYLVTLSEGSTLNVVSWDKIKTMEIIDLNKSKCTVKDVQKEKKSTNVKLIIGTLIVLFLLVGLCKIYLENSPYHEIDDLLGSGRNEDALQASNKAIEKDPNSADAWYFKGNAFVGLTKYDDAIKAYDRAIAIIPYKSLYYIKKADTLNYLGRYDEGLNASNKAIEKDPNNADVWNSKGNAFVGLTKYDDAIKAYDKAIAIRPNEAIFYKNKANALNYLGRYDEGLNASNKAIEKDPNNADVWNSKGNAFVGLTKYDDAIEAYDKAIAIRPNEAIFYKNKANTLNYLGRYDEGLNASRGRAT
jgi:tetratricopeptide (TPR) repeat protein